MIAGAPGSTEPAGRLRVVRVSARLSIGGPARHVGLLASGLHPLGVDTTVVFGEVDTSEASFEDLLDPAWARPVKLAGLGRQVRPFDDVSVAREAVSSIDGGSGSGIAPYGCKD